MAPAVVEGREAPKLFQNSWGEVSHDRDPKMRKI